MEPWKAFGKNDDSMLKWQLKLQIQFVLLLLLFFFFAMCLLLKYSLCKKQNKKNKTK